MALTDEERELYNVAKGALPGFVFATDGDRELIAGLAKMIHWTRRIIRGWVDATFRQAAEGEWLDEQMRDLGTSRQTGETDIAGHARIAQIADVVTEPALLAIANRMLVAEGVAPDAVIVRMRRDRAFLGKYDDGVTTPRAHAYLSRGYRVGVRAPNEIVVILPYGTPESVRAPLDAELKLSEAAAQDHIIEIRGVP